MWRGEARVRARPHGSAPRASALSVARARGVRALAVCLVTALAGSGCAASEGAPAGAREQATASPHTSTEPTPSPDTHDQPSTGDSDLLPRSGVGTLVSPDGNVTGTVTIATSYRADEATWLGEVTFVDLQTSFEELSVGGVLEGDTVGECFDAGLRTGGGSISSSDAAPTSLLPLGAEGRTVTTLVLTTIPLEPDDACIYRVVAHAEIEWGEH